MEGKGEISDTDSGIIIHSGPDSPTTNMKDVVTHTRAMKLKNQSLEDRLELCLLELKKLCIREAELTGCLSADYPLLPGEKPPPVRRRIGAAFLLDEQSFSPGSEETELSSVDAKLALQLKIYEAACKLCREDNLDKAVKRSRLQQRKREEKKVKQLQEEAFRLRLERGRSSPRPGFITALQEHISDDSSLSDSAVVDEEVTSQSSQPSVGLPHQGRTDSPHLLPGSPQAPIDTSYHSPVVASLTPPLTPSQPPHLSIEELRQSFNSSLEYESPPIEHSPWTESSLDQPYQKSKKKTRSSSKKMSSSPAKTEVLPPLEACLGHSPLPLQVSHLKLCHTQSCSTPSTPEICVRRQLSLRASPVESLFDPERHRGRTRCPSRRLTDCTVTLPEPPTPRMNYGIHTNSEDSNSEHSCPSYNSSPCQEVPCDLPKQCPSAFQHQHPSPTSSLRPLGSPSQGFYQNARHQSSPSFHRGYYEEDMGYYLVDMDMARSYYGQQTPPPPNRHDYWYNEAPVQFQRAQRPLPQGVRLSRTPSLWDHPCHASRGLPRQVVNEELKSWHQRNQVNGPRRPRSLDRQGAVRVKNPPGQESHLSQNHKYQEQVIQRRVLQRAADDTPVHWFTKDTSEIISQV